MRISVAARCRIMIEGRYALVISINALTRRKERSLSPPGGAIKTTKRGMQEIAEQFHVDPISFELGTDLRFPMSSCWLGDLRKWLETTKRLESAPAMREFAEEMEQRKILTLEEAQLVTFQLAQRHEERIPLWRYRAGSDPQLVDTYAFEWIYDAVLPPNIRARLVCAAQQPEPLVELVTAEEIKRGYSKRGSKIDDWTRLLL